MKIKIKGTGSAVPKLRVTNDDLSKLMDTSDEWIRSRTGIGARHLAVEETTTGLAVAAAKEALKDAEMTAEELDLIIAATVTADKFLFRVFVCIKYGSDVSGKWCIQKGTGHWSGNSFKDHGLE